jgi:hypothetical protein
LSEPIKGETHVIGIVGIFTIIAMTVTPLLLSAPAHAQATRTWVSGVGDDANPCSRTAPCKTFAGAISKTVSGGEISVLDPGGFGAVTITKSISITNDGVGEAGVLVAGTNGIVIAAGTGDVVNLRGLIIDGSPLSSLNGVRILSAKAVHVQNCVIKNFSGGFGIDVAATAGTVEVFVNDTVLSNNGNGQTGDGVLAQPSGGASSRVVLNRVTANGNTFGVRVDGTGNIGGTGTGMFVRDSVVSGNVQSGISILVPAGNQGGTSLSSAPLFLPMDPRASARTAWPRPFWSPIPQSR